MSFTEILVKNLNFNRSLDKNVRDVFNEIFLDIENVVKDTEGFKNVSIKKEVTTKSTEHSFRIHNINVKVTVSDVFKEYVKTKPYLAEEATKTEVRNIM